MSTLRHAALILVLSLLGALGGLGAEDPYTRTQERLAGLQAEAERLEGEIAQRTEVLQARVLEQRGHSRETMAEQGAVDELKQRRQALDVQMDILRDKLARMPAPAAAAGTGAGVPVVGDGATPAEILAAVDQVEQQLAELERLRSELLARHRRQVLDGGQRFLAGLDLSPVFARPPAGASMAEQQRFAGELAELNQVLVSCERAAQGDDVRPLVEALRALHERWALFDRFRPGSRWPADLDLAEIEVGAERVRRR